jgi:DNA repair protein RadC
MRRLVEENLRLLAELRVPYGSAARHARDADPVTSPEQIHRLLGPEMTDLAQEQLRVVLLDTRNRVIDVVLVYQGNVSSAVVRMAELFREAIIANAPAMVLTHNHPSGSPEPSDQDISLTKEAAQAATLLGIQLLDQVLIGQDGAFVSLKERSLF